VAFALGRLRARGLRLDHADITIVCETPRIAPHRAAMQVSVAAMLGLSIESVSVKATTTEGLGFTGRGEGIAAFAAVTARASSPDDE
jgi:2-C-methyl-D-erythritol 4-phosphate cytidylyltransferase/2-C-methyl-D-erythritol 2,4-cyclodiphosphate synthase